MKIVLCWVMAGALVLLAGGCTSTYDPNVHPTRLKVVDQSKSYDPVDLDGDGRDEFVQVGQVPGGSEQSVVIQSLTGRATAQVHFTGRVLSLQFVDATQNGSLEIVAPVVQGDSLFYNVVSADGRKLRRFFAVSGEPRREPGGTIRWDPRKVSLRTADVTNDGAPELISLLGTGFARQPRGVWVHTYPEGREVGHQRMGALVSGSDHYFGDVDEDSAPEWLFGSIATNNGADAGGISDDRAYLGSIEAAASPEMEWTREMGETFSEVYLRHGDLDGDGQEEFVAMRAPRQGRQQKSFLYQIDPANGETRQRFVPEAVLRSVHVGTLGEEGRDQIVIRDERGTIRVLNSQFEVVHERSIDAPIQDVQFISDITGDDREEIVVGTERGTLWLSPDLSTFAATPKFGSKKWRVVQTGVGGSPRVAVDQNNGNMTHFRAVQHPWWWIYRYGPMAGLLLGIVAVVSGGVAGMQRYRRFRLREAVRKQVSTHSDREWLLIHPDHEIHETSAGAREFLGIRGTEKLTWTELREQVPDLAGPLDALAAQATSPTATEVTVDGDPLTVTFTPLEVRRGGRPYWLVWLEPSTPDVEEFRAQSLMAQRVAHDLKNPLTSILLTLQRMQMDYQEEAPELADTLDDYTERIEDRIGSLRRMTTNVLKFVGKENLRRTPTDVSQFLEELVDTIEKSLPPDIEMQRQFEEGLPVVAVDQDQMRSVVENLVTNAVEAMPEGGVLTLSTRLARDLYFEDEPGARDYVVVEVRDTGVGMKPSVQARLFEPGFSTRDDTGLGMALARKIVDDHGGEIEVESEPEVGTSVTLYLPTKEGGDASTEHD